MHQPPQGYFHVGGATSVSWSPPCSSCARWPAAREAGKVSTGEVRAQPQRAHRLQRPVSRSVARSAIQGKSDARAGPLAWRATVAGGIVVEPHLCVGWWRLLDRLPERRTGLRLPGRRRGPALAHPAGATRNAGKDAALLLPHSEGAGARIIGEFRPRRAHRCQHPRRAGARAAGGVGTPRALASSRIGATPPAPARWGCCLSEEEAPEYREALAEQMAVAQAILSAGLPWRIISVSRHATRATSPRSTRLARRAGAGAWRSRRLARRPRSAPRWRSRSRTICSPRRRRRLEHPGKPRRSGCRRAAGHAGGRRWKVHAVPELRRRACPEARCSTTLRLRSCASSRRTAQCGLCAITCPEDAIQLQPAGASSACCTRWSLPLHPLR